MPTLAAVSPVIKLAEMANGLGLSVGATNLAAVVLDRTAVTRAPVLTLFGHRPPEVGLPSENPALDERGLIVTHFVDRVGDPVAIVAADGSTHRGEILLADALRALLFAVTRGQPAADPVGVTHPAHWSAAAVDALRSALAAVPEFGGSPVVSDAAAALTALQHEPGLPTRGVIAVCDFGGTGASITLADAGAGYRPIGPTVRHPDLSGDLIDQALLTHVVTDLTAAGSIDLTGTSAIGSLSRLRGQCRDAKERLSTASVAALAVDLPGHRGDVRLTRTELDGVLRQPLTGFVDALQDALTRNGIRPSELVAVATAGGGARIPMATTMLSERFRVPVVTTGQPELTAAIGGGLTASHGAVEEGPTAVATAMAPVVPPPIEAPESSTFRALAWSDADDVPDVVAGDPYHYPDPADAAGGLTDARPQLQFGEYDVADHDTAPPPWYRRRAVLLGVGATAAVAAVTALLLATRDDSEPAPTSTTESTTTTTAPPPESSAAPAPAEPGAPQPQAPQTRTVTQQAPAPVAPESPAPPPAEPPPAETPPPSTEAPPPPSEPPPSTTRPPLIPTIPTIPPIPTIPGLPPFIPQPGQPAG